MKRLTSGKANRQGSVIALTALLLVPLIGMVAFAVDMAYIVMAYSQLQNASDAAALAGATPLISGYFNTYYQTSGTPLTTQQKADLLTSTLTQAKRWAQVTAWNNSAGGTTHLALQATDIEFGCTRADGAYATGYTTTSDQASYTYTPGTFPDGAVYPTTSGSPNFPNTIKVTIRRDATTGTVTLTNPTGKSIASDSTVAANGTIGLFFAPVLGQDSANAATSAAATIYQADNSNKPQGSGMLPMVFDINQWKQYLYNSTSPDGTVHTDANGNAVISVYPTGPYTGNFGLLSLDNSNDGASVISNWINNGVSQANIQSLVDANLIPLSTTSNTNSNPIWKGDPGLKDSDIQAVADHVGQSFLLPLFAPMNPGTGVSNTNGVITGNGPFTENSNGYVAGNGNGSNYYYDVVQFVSVKIVSVDSTGNNKSIMVQPSAYVDPNLAYLTSGTGTYTVAMPPTGSIYSSTPTFGTPRLSQ